MLVLGLTGNIGCGKSSLSNIFREDYNIDIIDADIISRNIFEDEILLKQVFESFGDSIKNADGSLNRKALGNIVFNNDAKLVQLNSLTHPKIKEQILAKVELARREEKEMVFHVIKKHPNYGSNEYRRAQKCKMEILHHIRCYITDHCLMRQHFDCNSPESYRAS